MQKKKSFRRHFGFVLVSTLLLQKPSLAGSTGKKKEKTTHQATETLVEDSPISEIESGNFKISIQVSLLSGELRLGIFYKHKPFFSYGSRQNSLSRIEDQIIFAWKLVSSERSSASSPAPLQKTKSLPPTRLFAGCQLIVENSVLKEVRCRSEILQFFYNDNHNLTQIQLNGKSLLEVTYWDEMDAVRLLRTTPSRESCDFIFKYSQLSQNVQTTELQKTCQNQKQRNKTKSKETSIAFFEIDP